MIFEYKDANKHPAHCDIEKIGNIIVMTELASNTGASITNSCEYIAKQYAEQHGLSVDDVVWIERYDERSYGNKRVRKNNVPNYTLVTFENSVAVAGLLKPSWERLTAGQFQVLTTESANKKSETGFSLQQLYDYLDNWKGLMREGEHLPENEKIKIERIKALTDACHCILQLIEE